MDHHQEASAARGAGFEDPRILRALLTDSHLAWLWLVPRVTLGWLWFETGRHQLQKPLGGAGTGEGWSAQLLAGGRTLAGIALILGAFVGIAAFAGGVLHIAAMGGHMTPLLFGAVIWLVLAWKTAGWIGLDRWLLPLLGMPWSAGELIGERLEQEHTRHDRRQAWIG